MRVHGVIDFADIPTDAQIVIGPEGGFSGKEKYPSSYFGKRILRSETAAVVAATLVLKEHEKWYI